MPRYVQGDDGKYYAEPTLYEALALAIINSPVLHKRGIDDRTKVVGYVFSQRFQNTIDNFEKRILTLGRGKSI